MALPSLVKMRHLLAASNPTNERCGSCSEFAHAPPSYGDKIAVIRFHVIGGQHERWVWFKDQQILLVENNTGLVITLVLNIAKRKRSEQRLIIIME